MFTGPRFTRTVNTVRFRGRVVCRVISKYFSNEKIANMMSLQTGNKLSYTTEFVITFEKEKMEKVTVVGYHICGPVCYSCNETYKDDDLLVGHATGLCVAMSAVSEVHVHLLTSLSLKTIQNWLFRYMEEYEASYLIRKHIS